MPKSQTLKQILQTKTHKQDLSAFNPIRHPKDPRQHIPPKQPALTVTNKLAINHLNKNKPIKLRLILRLIISSQFLASKDHFSDNKRLWLLEGENKKTEIIWGEFDELFGMLQLEVRGGLNLWGD